MTLNSGRMVYNVDQLANLINRDHSIAAVYHTRIWRSGLAKRVIRGKITFSDNDFIIATQLVEPSYISLWSALLFHKVSQQIPARIHSVTPRNSITFVELGLEYHKIPPGLLFGYDRHSIG